MAATFHPSHVLLLPTIQKAKNSSPPNMLLQNYKTLNELTQLHYDMMKKGLFHNLVVACVQIGTHESLNYALNVFKEDDVATCSLYTCNSLIRGCASSELGKEAIFIYVYMVVVMGVVPEKFTFPFLLSVCSKILAFSEGAQVHAVVVKMGL
ncbi:pentatricopeptide repeat-containing protein At3g22690-like [Cicer arietinum]|uniref:pentatricopeptide repeat-containing protein At3g22690-like n=1 Tax=Cicer arietinum TaxID=3827 RepID=UPI003CC52722